MEALLLVCLIGLLLRWLYIKARFEELEGRIRALEVSAMAPAVAPPAPAPEPMRLMATPSQAPPPAREPAVSLDQLETLVGGNWLNKVGVFVLVIGLALALGYSYAHVGRGGRVAISLAVSTAMLVTGAILEPRQRYRTFARG